MSLKKRLIILMIYCAVAETAIAQYIPIPKDREKPSVMNLLFAGDIMQHEAQLNEAKREDGTYSFSANYRYIKKDIAAADIAIGNLETPIGKKGFSGYPSFCAPDSFLYAAVGAGFDVLLLANNHCLDKGKETALHTIDMMDSLGVAYCGVYRNSKEKDEQHPLMIEKKGVRIALLNYTYGTNGRAIPHPLVVNLIDKDAIAKDIQKARNMSPDAIIACIHWGDEYVSLPPVRIKELADWLISQGVDHIIGNHPHVIQPIEVRFNKERSTNNAVVYSTGNLLSNMSLRRTDGGLMIGMKLIKYYNHTYLMSLNYLLTWIAPKMSNGKRDFTIYPASTTEITGNSNAKEKLELFLDDSHKLMERHNKGRVNEMHSDSVRITL